ncbi:MAG: RsmB/NOP family class I SAM-dependent RNA methyltransferase [Gammaproteobacteria bacterium]|nr:RsmB/NOP family class I SAM-dependent RNA methyltransferase [Gammaproteobacteria bacterium]
MSARHYARAAELLAAVLNSPYPADREIERYFRSHREMGSKDRAFAAEAVYACLRHKRLLEHQLDAVTPHNLLAAYLVSQQGWSARALQEAGYRGDAAALVTRIRQTDLRRLPSAVRVSLPDWIYDSLAAQLGESETIALAEALNQPAPVDVRVNTLKSKRDEAAAALAAEGYPCTPTPYSPFGLRLNERAPLFKTRAFQEGLIEIQDEGSQLLALLMEPRRHEMVADFCAGGGGKTLALGALMANTGTLYAFDVLEKRLNKLKPRLARAGLDTVRRVVIGHERDPRVQRLRGKLDRVLVDAPCTGLGTLRRNPDIKWRAHSLADITALQQRILEAAAELVKPGGRLVYATCSPLRAENDDVIERFLSSHPEFHVIPVNDILARKHIPLALPAGEQALRLYTHRHHTDTFYAIALERAGAA